MSDATQQPETVPRHPIAVVALRTGISPDLLRAWERRYQAVQPARTDDGQRLYSDADIERLRVLRRATDGGRAIGRIATLPLPELLELASGDIPATAPAAGSSVPPEVLDLALTQVRGFDAASLDRTLRRASASLPIGAFIELSATLLREVGDEWHAGRLSVGQEHLATAVIELHLHASIRGLQAETATGTVVAATLSGDRHAAGALLVAAAAAAAGRPVVYLGADLPPADIAEAATRARAAVVALSLVFVMDPPATASMLRELRLLLPSTTQVLAGGPGVDRLRATLHELDIAVEPTASALTARLGRSPAPTS